jgi:hypothetical protein
MGWILFNSELTSSKGHPLITQSLQGLTLLKKPHNAVLTNYVKKIKNKNDSILMAT